MRQHHPSCILRFSTPILVILLTSCSSILPTPAPTVTSSPIPTNTPIPTATATPIPSPTPIPAPARATYTLNTLIDYDQHTVQVDETIVYPNHTGQALNGLVLAAVPNLWANCFTLGSISVNGVPSTNYTLNGQRIDLPLAAPLPPETTITVGLQYTIVLPFAEQENPNVSRPRIFGYTTRQLNLTNWYPFIVPFSNGDFVLHEPWFYGEHLVYDAADYEVDLRFVNPSSTPVVASSGAPEPQDGYTRYTLTAGRAFAVSASREFQVSSMQVGDIVASSYYFSFNEGAGQAALQASAQAIQFFSARYGPYPHKTLSIVMGDFNDGMEYSALFYLSRDFYSLYDFTPKNYLTFVAVHETSHQWWFEQVANDQALQPWLDEALATYSEPLYYENYNPDLVAWWWSYRVDFYNPQGFVDIPIYDGQGFRPYTNAVYFRGAHFLDDLRKRIGDEAFFAFIQDYYLQGNGRIVTANDFFRILRTHTTTDFSDITRLYFQNVY